jgi:hypothetical protein
MRLRQLFESTQISVAFCFGRFNPAHQGHAKVWNAVKAAGQQWFVGTNPTTVGPNDPLPFDVKSAWMMAIDPDLEGHLLGETSILTLASKIFEQVGEGATIAYVTDAQDWQWSGKLLNDYNGKQATHGYYNFVKIVHVASPRVTSATDLRNAARAGDEQKFYQLAGVDPSLQVNGKSYFDTVVEACVANPEKVKRAKKEKAVAEESNSIKYANKVIREMRANDFIKEGSAGKPGTGGTKKMTPDQKSSMKDAVTVPGLNMSTGSAYKNYRMGIALAGAPDYPTKMAADNWIGGDPLISSYTKEEFDMVKAAAKLVGAGTIQNWSGDRSKETADTNVSSPVNKRKPNKYGV